MTPELFDAAQQALKELSEARKIIRASQSRHLAKDWDQRATNALASLRRALTQRPRAVPMTLAEVAEAHVKAPYTSNDSFYSIFSCGIRAAEAHHRIGIAAPAGGEEQA